MSKSNIILLSIILSLVLIIFFGLGWLIFSGRQENINEVTSAKENYSGKTKIYSVSGDSIITNLNTGNVNDKRIIRVGVQLLVVDDDKTIQELTSFNGKIRDTIISILKTKTPEEAIKPDAPQVIKNEIMDAINKAFKTDKVLDVYFEEFIIQ